MLQGDFNHMANIITVLFEQITAKSSCRGASKESESASNRKSPPIVYRA